MVALANFPWNSLDGGVFAHMKRLIKLHQGLAKKKDKMYRRVSK